MRNRFSVGCSLCLRQNFPASNVTLNCPQKRAYHEILAPWVNNILIGQGHIKLETVTTMAELQNGATNLLATSSFYRGNVLLAGRLPCPPVPTACAATDGETMADHPSSDKQLESVLKMICGDIP
jgi:hypothetical protein